MARSEHENIVTNQLRIVLVWSKHIGFYPLFSSLQGNGSYDVIRLETIYLEDRNMVCFEDAFDDRHREFDVFRSLFSLCFVSRKSLMAEGFTMVESHRNVGRLLLGKYFIKGIAEPHHTRSIETLRIDSRGSHKGVIRPINERISV